MTEILKNSDNIAQTIANAVKFSDIVEINKNQELKTGNVDQSSSSSSSGTNAAVQQEIPTVQSSQSVPFDGFVIMGFSIPKMTLYLAIGFVLILAAYYFYNSRNKAKDDSDTQPVDNNAPKEGKKKKNKKNNIVKE